jgi:hypothetical protein
MSQGICNARGESKRWTQMPDIEGLDFWLVFEGLAEPTACGEALVRVRRGLDGL